MERPLTEMGHATLGDDDDAARATPHAAACRLTRAALPSARRLIGYGARIAAATGRLLSAMMPRF